MRLDPTAAGSPPERIRRVEREVDRRIREAIEAGDLSGLPGEGRPLPADPDEGASERWAALHVLRVANAAPAWAALRGEIERDRNSLVRRARAQRDWLALRRAALADVPAERILEHARATDEAARRSDAERDARLAELNRKIARYDLHVRAGALQLLPLTPERLDELAGRSPS